MSARWRLWSHSLFVILLTFSAGLHAQWDPPYPQWSGFGDPGLTERTLHGCNDAHGNVFLTGPFFQSLGLQRWDSLGYRRWGIGIVAPNASVVNRDHLLLPDGEGGCYIGYVRNTGQVGAYIQHLDSAGTPVLPWPGRRVFMRSSSTWSDLWMVRDSSHIFLTMTCEATSGNERVYAQKLDLALNRQWDSTGVAVTPDTADHRNARCVLDGYGGIVLLYRAYFSGTATYMRMQRLDSLGTLQWGLGTLLHTTWPVGNFCRTELRVGAHNDYYACWDGGSNAFNTGVYLSRVDTAGTPLWGALPVVVNDAVGSQDLPSMQVDALGDAYVVWRDLGALPNVRSYMQRVDTAGTVRWNPAKELDGNGLNTVFPKLVAGSASFRVFWTAYYNGSTRILTQVFDSAGVAQCPLPGDTVGYAYHQNIIDDLVLEMPQGGYVLVVVPSQSLSGASLQITDPPCLLATGTAAPVAPRMARIYPTPTSDVLHVMGTKPFGRISVCDLQGRRVLEAVTHIDERITLTVSELAPGIYLLLDDGFPIGRFMKE